MHICIYIYVYVSISIHTHTHTYKHIYIYTYIYIYIYIHTYIGLYRFNPAASRHLRHLSNRNRNEPGCQLEALLPNLEVNVLGGITISRLRVNLRLTPWEL